MDKQKNAPHIQPTDTKVPEPQTTGYGKGTAHDPDEGTEPTLGGQQGNKPVHPAK